MRQRHIVLAFLVSLAIITFLDRLCIAVSGPRIQQELGLSSEQWGWVLGAFILAYGAFEIPTGAMGDRLGQRRVLTRVVLWWSAFTALTGAATSFVPLVITRFLFGMGEAGAYPNMAGVTARWFPFRERARIQGFIWGASRAGGALAPLIVVPLQSAFGWRMTFWVFGGIGVLWCIIWWWWFRDHPSQNGNVTAAEMAEIGPVGRVSHDAPWAALWRSRQLWTIVCMYGSYAWGSWFYFSWLHTWMVKSRGFTEAEMGLFSALPFAVGAAANICGGFLSDAAARRYGATFGRRLVGSTSLGTAALLLVATAFTSDKVMAMALLTAGFGVMDLMLPSAWAICLDIGGEHSGAVTGAMNTAGQLGGFLCTVIFGYVVGTFNSYDAPLILIAIMLTISAFLFSRIDPSRPLLPDTSRPLAQVEKHV